MIKVLIVDDSLTIRKRVAELIENDPEMRAAGEAENGKKAIELVKSLSPDVILMDLVMPIMDGQEATELIMAYHPTPIIIHSSAENRGEEYKTMDALSAGALDFIEKTCPDWEKEIIYRIKRASRIKVVTHLKRKMLQKKNVAFPAINDGTSANGYNLLIIGASTGGPKVVLELLGRLPSNFPIPVIVVIHVADSFRSSIAEWLNNNAGLLVKNPTDGEIFKDKQRTVYLAPPGRHLIIQGSNLRLTSTSPVNYCRPSIDVLFESVAGDSRLRPIAVLLTGMGKDGAKGLKAIKDCGGYTIAQDEKTCIVFGMPREAIKIGATTTILPDFEIPDRILRLVGI